MWLFLTQARVKKLHRLTSRIFISSMTSLNKWNNQNVCPCVKLSEYYHDYHKDNLLLYWDILSITFNFISHYKALKKHCTKTFEHFESR